MWGVVAEAAPAQNEERGQNEKKFKPVVSYNFRSLWHTKCSIIFTPKAWCTPAIITRK